jgi:hypothetical protein
MEEIKAPNNYFELKYEEKVDVCVGILETMYEMIMRMTSTPKVSNVELMEKILDSTLQFNEELEEYEICQVLYDTKKLMNEHKNH